MRILSILMVALLLAGCQKENITPSLEELSKDTRFQALIKFNYAVFKAAVAGTAHYGYTSQEAYEEALAMQGENVRYVRKRYRWEGHSREAQLAAVVSTFKELKLYGYQEAGISNISGRCEQRRTACLVSTAAEATLMHLGCTALDLTIIGGIACHGAAITWQLSESAICNMDYSECRN